MKNISGQIRESLDAAKRKLMEIPQETTGIKSSPSAWSKKEIIGHLIDSAANNHQRFVRGMQNAAGKCLTYDQNRWVEVQGYNDMEWGGLVELFLLYNYHLCRVIDVYPPDALKNPCNIGKNDPVTLEFVITDYLRHLKHHLGKILGK